MRVFSAMALFLLCLHLGCGLTVEGWKLPARVEQTPGTPTLTKTEQTSTEVPSLVKENRNAQPLAKEDPHSPLLAKENTISPPLIKENRISPPLIKGGQGGFEAALEHLLPADDLIDGWRMNNKPIFYNEDNLFEYIDGKAEEYRAYDFRMLISAQYSPSLTVDIYDMGADANAFGIYSLQRYPEADYVEIGGQGFFTEASLEFWKGRYFVKISTVETLEPLRDVMVQFGQNISSKIKGDFKPPAILNYLPEKGYVNNSAVFALRDIMGQSFLKNGVVAEYTIGEATCRLFLTQYPSSEEALEAFNRYSEFLKDSGGEIEPRSDIGERAVVATTSFYGRVIAFHQRFFVGGILSAPEGSEAMDLLHEVLLNLEKEPTNSVFS